MCFRFKPEFLDAMLSCGSAQTRVRPKQWRYARASIRPMQVETSKRWTARRSFHDASEIAFGRTDCLPVQEILYGIESRSWADPQKRFEV
jgi:hypothetical protein